MPSQYTDSFQRAAKEAAVTGKVMVHGGFNLEMQSLVLDCIYIAKQSLLFQKKKWCQLIIDSNGGSTDVLNSIKFAMLDSGLKYHGIVQAKARSCGFDLLQACNWRSALSNSEILVHYGSDRLSNNQLSGLIENHEYVINYHQIRLAQYVTDLAMRSGLSREKIHELNRFERNILAEEALSLGLIDEVIWKVPISEVPS
jgi:ATP-dependent protease ClpP protease subunit